MRFSLGLVTSGDQRNPAQPGKFRKVAVIQSITLTSLNCSLALRSSGVHPTATGGGIPSQCTQSRRASPSGGPAAGQPLHRTRYTAVRRHVTVISDDAGGGACDDDGGGVRGGGGDGGDDGGGDGPATRSRSGYRCCASDGGRPGPSGHCRPCRRARRPAASPPARPPSRSRSTASARHPSWSPPRQPGSETTCASWYLSTSCVAHAATLRVRSSRFAVWRIQSRFNEAATSRRRCEGSMQAGDSAGLLRGIGVFTRGLFRAFCRSIPLAWANN